VKGVNEEKRQEKAVEAVECAGEGGRLSAIRRCDFLTCPAGKKLVAGCSINPQLVRFPVGAGLTRSLPREPALPFCGFSHWLAALLGV